MKLSIIVPVYNVEAYLLKCVASLLDQDLPASEYEIILVDDGSTDGSGARCDALAAGHGNVRVIHQQNRGLSGARNTGVAAAAGQYVLFVDSDDFLEPNVLGGLVKQGEEEDLDILRFNYQNVNEAGDVFEPNKYAKPFVDFSEEVCDGVTFLNERLGYACYACQFIVKASILKESNGLFKEGIWFEDVDWTPRILLQAGRVASTTQIVYNYLFRAESISRTSDIEKKKKRISDQFLIIDSLEELSKGTRDSRWLKGMVSQIALSIIQTVSQSFYSERKGYINTLREKHVFPLSSYHATKAAKRKIRLANLSPYLLCSLLRMTQK